MNKNRMIQLVDCLASQRAVMASLWIIALVGRSMTDILRLVLVTWCWFFVHCTTAARTRTLRLSDDNQSDLNLTTPQLIAKYGYPIETHLVENDDGYILELHRIPHGRMQGEGKRPPVLIHHALLCSSFDWVVMGPKRALSFILADAGYDVWLANARGNTYSKKHITIEPTDPKFWEFSWHEMGTKDVPAEIDYILAKTGHQKLLYIGHSMGTTMFFVMMSERPEYNDKIAAMVALAPVAVFTPTRSRVFHFIQSFMEGFLERFLNVIGYQEFLPQNSVLNPLSRIMCKENVITQRFCIEFMYMITGKSTQVDKKRLTVNLAHTPAGCSTRQVMHFAQEALSGEFQQYDFGKDKNMEKYGQETPPKYRLENTTAPVALFYSDNDKLAPARNVKKVAEKLPNLINTYRVPLKTFNHLDFMWGEDANVLLFKEVLRILKSYSSDTVAT